MAIVAWSALHPEIVPEVMGCPLLLVDNAIRNAAIELCDHGMMYRVDLTPIVTVADQPTYAMSYDINTGVAQVIDAYTASRRLLPKTTMVLGEGGAVYEEQTGEPVEYFQTTPDTLRLYPIPDDVYTINLSVALVPARTALGLEAFLMDHYRDELAAGALARLMNMSNKPWTDKATAKEKKAEFTTGKGNARIDGMRNFTTASLKVTPRAFR
jgi:hypothetical protein